MASYLVIHAVREYPDSQEDWLELWERVWSKTGGSTQWRGSFYSPEEDRLYCIWEADRPEDIEACFEKDELLKIAPIESMRIGAYFDVAAFGETSA